MIAEMTGVGAKKHIRPCFFSTGIVAAALAVAFFTLNMLTPLIADDFGLAFAYGSGKRISSLFDIFDSLRHYYVEWGGRVPAFFWGELFVLVGKTWFNICNTAVFCAFLFLLYFHAFGSFKKINPYAFLAVNMLVWFTVPSWGEDFLWLNGSVVYLWPTALILLFLVPYRIKTADAAYAPGFFPSVLFLLFGAIAGWGNENLCAAALFFLITYFALKRHKEEPLALFEIFGAAGLLIGFALLLFSPGTHYRGTTVELKAQFSPLAWFFRQIALAAWRFFESGYIPAGAAAVVGAELLSRQRKNFDAVALPYAAAGFAAFFAMAVSPEFPTRASFTGVVFLCVALLSLARRLEVQGQIKKNFPALYAFALGAFLFSFACATKDIREIHVKWKQRAEYILAQKEKGVLDVEIREPIPTSVLLGNKYAARGNDITTDPGKWPNNSIADYFGIRSIRGVENSDEIW